MGKEEYLMQLSMLEQQAREIQQQVSLVNQKINELSVLKISLEKLHETREKEFLAPLGEGVFVKAKLEEKELFVNVGSKIIVRKSIKDTEAIIDKQQGQLEDVRAELEGNIELLNKELQKIVNKARKEESEGEGSTDTAFSEAGLDEAGREMEVQKGKKNKKSGS